MTFIPTVCVQFVGGSVLQITSAACSEPDSDDMCEMTFYLASQHPSDEHIKKGRIQKERSPWLSAEIATALKKSAEKKTTIFCSSSTKLFDESSSK